MEIGGALSLSMRSCGWRGSERGGGWPISTVEGILRRETRLVVKVGSLRSLEKNGGLRVVRSSYKKPAAVDAEDLKITSVKESLILKKKAQEIAPSLNGRSIYLVGLMGSGKTTVGKILAEALEYSFVDSDKLVEEALGDIPVAQIFKEHSEKFFRDKESKALHGLSSMNRLVVATGGGAVIRPINWSYMKEGVTVWLDVPVEALARRISAIGTASRPLLDQESGDVYTKAFLRLSTLFKERSKTYAQADARVSLLCIAESQGKNDVNTLSPTAIAAEALLRIEEFLMATTTAGETQVCRSDC